MRVADPGLMSSTHSEQPADQLTDECRRLFDKYGEIRRAAYQAGVSEKEVVRRLVGVGVATLDERHCIQRLDPEDVGLSALNCADCGERSIGSHPCPACGFDPRNGRIADIQGELLKIFDYTAGPVPEGVVWRVYSSMDDATHKYRALHALYELERTGLVKQVGEDPPTYTRDHSPRRRTRPRRSLPP